MWIIIDTVMKGLFLTPFSLVNIGIQALWIVSLLIDIKIICARQLIYVRIIGYLALDVNELNHGCFSTEREVYLSINYNLNLSLFENL